MCVGEGTQTKPDRAGRSVQFRETDWHKQWLKNLGWQPLRPARLSLSAQHFSPPFATSKSQLPGAKRLFFGVSVVPCTHSSLVART